VTEKQYDSAILTQAHTLIHTQTTCAAGQGESMKDKQHIASFKTLK